MIVDTSALLAILQDEPEAATFAAAIEDEVDSRMSAAALLEASMLVESRYGVEGVREFDRMRLRGRIAVAPIDEEQALLARDAFSRYGKGRHPARLNFGDCFAYALSIQSGEPLLYKGEDFARTDVPVHAASTPQPARNR